MKELFLKRAKENLLAAEILLDKELLNASANRAYYAAFHAAIAALYHFGIQLKPEHKTVQILFTDNFFNRRKIISSKFKGYLSELQRKRNLADYMNGVSRRETYEQFKNTKELVEIIFEVVK